jgi:hypothetical protein
MGRRKQKNANRESKPAEEVNYSELNAIGVDPVEKAPQFTPLKCHYPHQMMKIKEKLFLFLSYKYLVPHAVEHVVVY